MHRKLMSQSSGVLSLASNIPPSLAEFCMPEVPCVSAEWPQGAACFQDWKGPVRLRYSQFLFHEQDTIFLTENESLLTLEFIITDHLSAGWNMYANPSIDYSIQGDSDRFYGKVELCYSMPQLSILTPYSRSLDSLLVAFGQGISSSLFPKMQQVPASILESLWDVLYNPYSEKVRNLYVEARGMEILIDLFKTFAPLLKRRVSEAIPLFNPSYN